MTHNVITPPSLYGRDGRRKYISPAERQRFLAVADVCPNEKLATLALVLAFSGCRISEALALTAHDIDRDAAFAAIRSLKKRGLLVVREIPIPRELVERLGNVHVSDDTECRLWHWSRGRAWVLLKALMRTAEISGGPHATPKGLRHAYAIHALRSGVPLHLVQRWLGHANMATTAIYAQVVGPEEREFAERMWTMPPDNPDAHD